MEAEDVTCNRVIALAGEWGPENVTIRMPKRLRTRFQDGWGDGPVRVTWEGETDSIIVEVHHKGNLVIRVSEIFVIG